MEKILDNEEVKLIISALGLSLKNFKEKDLRYGKIAVAADADADGSNITNLIITLFYVLFPEVLKEGRLYRFFSPLYRVKKGKEVYYYYTEEEKLAGVIGGEVERYKGLGSLSAEDAKNIFFNPKWQRLEKLEWDDSCAKLIESLLGSDVAPRKEFVFNNIDFEEYGAI
jgi:DNA gyrase subunit B